MVETDPHPTEHTHVFGLDARRPGERRTALVVAVTAATMVVEIAAGLAFGSMALLADGLHMGSHAVALGVALAAYLFARRLARDPRFSFGVGKIDSLAAFSSAVLLAGFALLMAVESIGRLVAPRPIAFDAALLVAFIGLAVNAYSAWVLTRGAPGEAQHHGLGDHHHGPHAHGHDQDQNLRAAYFHVLADAVTSLLAIFALLAGKYLGAAWLDPVMGLVGAGLILFWARGLLVQAGRVLLDLQAGEDRLEALRTAVETEPGDRVTDAHLWSIGPGLWAAELTVVTARRRHPDDIRARIPAAMNVVHATVELHEADAEVPNAGIGT